jgi:hypothetical protein
MPLIAIKTNMSLRKFPLVTEQKKGKKLVMYPNIDRNLFITFKHSFFHGKTLKIASNSQ